MMLIFHKREMTAEETRATEELRQELISICDSLEVPRGKLYDGSPYMGRLKDNEDFCLKYSKEFGYYVLFGERGTFELMDGFPTRDREKAKYLLLKGEFSSGGFIYELNNRNNLHTEWGKKYTAEYDSRKAAFEYIIKILRTVFHRMPEDCIAEYTMFMNKWFSDDHWYFDRDSMTFEESA